MNRRQLGEARSRPHDPRRELESDIPATSAAYDSISPDNAVGRLTRMEAVQAPSISDAGKERVRKRLEQVGDAASRWSAPTVDR